LIEGLRGRESFQLQYIDDLNNRNTKLEGLIRELEGRLSVKRMRTEDGDYPCEIAVQTQASE